MKRPLVIFSAAATVFTTLALAPGDADAHRRRGWYVHVQTYPAPPPPPPPPQPHYGYYAPPPPVTYAAAPVHRHDPYPQVGLGIAGTVQGGDSEVQAVAGVAAQLQLRTSARSLLAFELQSVGARRADFTERRDLAGLLAGRLFLWNAPLTPYLELAAGMGSSSLELDGFHVRTSQMLGRYGLGLELRLGRHVVLDVQLAQLHRLRVDEHDDHATIGTAAVSPFDRHEQATELRGGLTLRF